MDIGRIKNNDTFYKGYEGEPQIMVSIKGDEELCLHIWDGYFEDIFGHPSIDGKGWIGFTRDYNQMEGVFSGETDCCEIVSPEEYLKDLSACQINTFQYEETKQAAELLCEFLRYAVDKGKTVLVTSL